jgi:hypothetical protein
MSVTKAMITLISQTQTLAAFAGRVRTGYGAQLDVRPYCLLWEVVVTPSQSLSGECDLDATTVQVDIYADKFHQADQLGRGLRDAVAAFQRGILADVWVASIMRTGGPRQTSERIGPGADSVLARVSLDFRLHHRIR